MPGAVAGVSRSGARELSAAGALAAGVPMTTGTPVRVASVTKALVATAALLGTEPSTVDAPVSGVAPEVGDPRITLGHLIGHTAGFGFDLPGDAVAGCGDGDDALARSVTLAARSGLRYRPGAAWSYSNVGYWAAGLVLARHAGTPFEDALTRLVLRPAGMTGTGWNPAAPRGRRPSGALLSTVADLLSFAEFVLDRPELIARASRPARAKTRGGRYALGWELTTGPVPVLWHDGDGSGYRARLLIVPAHRFAAAVVVVNDPRGRPVLDRVIGAELATLPGVRLPGRLAQARTAAQGTARLAIARLIRGPNGSW